MVDFHDKCEFCNLSNDKVGRIKLSTEDLGKQVYSKSAKGGLVNILSQGLMTILNLARGAVLARLLTPEDYGLQGMLIAPISLALVFKDLGLGTASVREKDISHAQINNLFWAGVLIGLISMLIVMACGPLFSWFYNEPRLTDMAIVLSVGYFWAGASIQHQALLRRQMLFGRMALVALSANLVSSVIAIVLAIKGAGYWALVFLLVLSNFFLAVGYWLATGWTPRLPIKGVKIKRLIRVGTDVASLNAFSTLAKQIDKIILGKLVGAYQLGLYNRAFMVSNLVSNQMRMSLFNVALPAMSSIQTKRETFKAYYLKFVAYLAHLTMPVAAFCFCFAKDIVLIYLGRKWLLAVPYLRILAIGAFFTPVITSLDQIPLALGYSTRYRNSGLFRNFVIIVFVIIGVYLWGGIGAAIAIAFANIASLPVFLPWTTKGSPITSIDYFKVLVNPFFTSLSPVFVVFCYRVIATKEDYSSIVAICLFCVVYINVFLITDCFHLGSDLEIAKKAMTLVRGFIRKNAV